jgi:hypothetical protein
MVTWKKITGIFIFALVAVVNTASARFYGMDPAPVNPEDPRTFNRYNYANNNPYRYVDPDGRYSLDYHTLITEKAVSGYKNLVNMNLPELTKDADFRSHSQDPENAYMHHMRDGVNNQSVDEAKEKYNKFLGEMISNGDAESLARALHAVQDSTADGHKDFQEWKGGMPSFKHIKGDKPDDEHFDAAVKASRQLLER